MARSTYPIPTREHTVYIANDGREFDSERHCRRHNAVLAIEEICSEYGWQGAVTSGDVSDFIVDNLSALAPWLDDLNG